MTVLLIGAPICILICKLKWQTEIRNGTVEHSPGLLIEKHRFLLDEAGSGESFSDLAILVRDCLPQLFVEVLVSLIRGGVFSLTNILQGCRTVTQFSSSKGWSFCSDSWVGLTLILAVTLSAWFCLD